MIMRISSPPSTGFANGVVGEGSEHSQATVQNELRSSLVM